MCSLGLILMFVCVLCKWCGRYGSGNTSWNMYAVHTWTRAAFADTMCQKISALQFFMRYAVAVKKGSLR